MQYDIDKIIEKMKTFSNKDKEEWSRKIISTQMPMLVVPTPKLREIAKEILKGDYIAYLESENFEYYENTIVYAKVLSKLKDFDAFKKYLYKYIPFIDNWASCDTLDLKITPSERENFFQLAKELLKDERTFARRIGVLIFFKMLDDVDYTKAIFEEISKLKNEQEYYVNMCIAWLLCDAFIKQRDITLEFLTSNQISDWVLNKTISKCRDSFRVSAEDKSLLKALKKK